MTDVERRAAIMEGIAEHLDDVLAALWFYADRGNYKIDKVSRNGYSATFPRAVLIDQGRLARIALGEEEAEVTQSRQSVIR